MPAPAHPWIVRRPRLALSVWLALAVLLVPLADSVPERLRVGGQDQPGVESTVAETLLKERIGGDFSDFMVVAVRSDAVPVESAAYRACLDALGAALRAHSRIRRTLDWRDAGPELVSADRRITAIVAGVRRTVADDPANDVPALRGALAAAAARSCPGIRHALTGGFPFDFDTRTITARDGTRLERLLVLPVLVVLIAAFGSLTAAALPVVVGLLAIELSFGVLAVVGAVAPVSIFTLNITTMMGLGVGIDYSLLVVSRFREALARGLAPSDAAAATARTAARTVVVSGATVTIGLAALLLVPLEETRSVGLGGLLVVAAAVLLAATFLPPLLALLGPWIEWPRGLARRTARLRSGAGWTRYADRLRRRPRAALAASLLVVAAMVAPLARLHIGMPERGWFPSGTEAERGLAMLQAMRAGGVLEPVRLVLRTTGGGPALLDGDRIRGLRALSDSVAADPRVAQVRGLVDASPGLATWQYVIAYADTARARARAPDLFASYLSGDGRVMLFDVILHDSVTLDGALAVVRRARRLDVRALRGLDGTELLVGGFAASSLDLQDALLASFPLVAVLVLGVTGLMLGLVFRSLLVPVKAILMNVLTVAAALGMTVVAFQLGAGRAMFGLSGPTGAVFALGPVLLFAIVFGLSMDYEVFLLARIKEAFDATHDNDAATTAGLAATGGTITSAALIMIMVFGAFAMARVLAVQMVGFGLAVAVLLDATVIRLVLVPAAMHLAGRFNWWPGWRPPAPAPTMEVEIPAPTVQP